MPKVSDLTKLGFTPNQAKHLGIISNGVEGNFNALTATGNNSQANAYQLIANVNQFTTSDTSNNSVKLPLAITDPNGSYIVSNLSDYALYLFPASGDNLNNLSANTAILLNTQETASITKQSDTSWLVSISATGSVKSTTALFSVGNTINNTASAVSYTSGNIGTIPANYFTKAGDAVHIKYKNYFGANTGAGRAMLFRIDPSIDADSDYYSTGSVGWTGEVVEMDVILYRRTLTEMRIEWSVKSTTSVNTCGRVALAVTTYNQTFLARSYVRGSVAGEVQSEYISGIGVKTL